MNQLETADGALPVIFQVLDELLRSPRAVAERARSGTDLRPLFLAAFGALVFGAGIFGATLATSRGGMQLLYSGVKLPLALTAILLLVVPAFHAIAAGLGRPHGFSAIVGLSLTGIGYALAPANPVARTGDVWEYKVVSEKDLEERADKSGGGHRLGPPSSC